MTRIGKQQLQTLIVLASPTCVLLTPGRSERGLVERGLLREREPGGGSCCITPAGLRALADAMDQGLVDDALEAMRKDAEARRQKAEVR